MEAEMSDFSRRDALLCVLFGGVLGFVLGVSVNSGVGPVPMHWGMWGFAPLAALVGVFWLFFWLLLIRGLFWGPPGWRRWGRRGGYYAGRLEDLPADFDDWHRRAHERMNQGGTPADDPGRRG
jgi:hypothetical protein